MNAQTTLRVSRRTAERLRELAAWHAERAAAGDRQAILPDPDPINPRSIGVTMDQVLTRLLDHYELYRARRARSDARRSRRKGGRR